MEVYRQASSGGVLLSSMGNPKPLPVYWDKILINASQVTNPSIDPLREPMETRTFLGQKPAKIERDENGKIIDELSPRSLSFPCRSCSPPCPTAPSATMRMKAWPARPEALGTYYNTGEGGLHRGFLSSTAPIPSYRSRPAASACIRITSEAGAAIEIKMGQGAKPGIGGHLPGCKNCRRRFPHPYDPGGLGRHFARTAPRYLLH